MSPDRLVDCLRAIREPRLRVHALIAALGESAPGAWVEALAALIEHAHRTGDPGAALAVQCLTHAAGSPVLPYATRQRLYEAAAGRGLAAVARLFLAASPAPARRPPSISLRAADLDPARGNAASQGPCASPGPERAGRPLTLGERKARARTHDRGQLGRMLRDPHPAVVAILLDNPHVTELDAVAIASARPAAPEALATLAAHPRWSVRHAVKRALVQNPSTPLADAIRIATTLPPGELAELAADAALPGPLRVHAAEVRAAALQRR